MLEFKATKEQRNALEGLAYWVADENYIRERYGNDDNEIQVCRKTITECIFPDLDRLEVPYWVQNSVIAIAENWRRYKENYFDVLCREKHIYL